MKKVLVPLIAFGFMTFSLQSCKEEDKCEGITCNANQTCINGDCIGIRPDVYDQAFHALNLKISQKFGKQDRWKTSLSAQNILGDLKEKLYESYNTASQVFERYNPGRSFSIGIAYLLR